MYLHSKYLKEIITKLMKVYFWVLVLVPECLRAGILQHVVAHAIRHAAYSISTRRRAGSVKIYGFGIISDLVNFCHFSLMSISISCKL